MRIKNCGGREGFWHPALINAQIAQASETNPAFRGTYSLRNLNSYYFRIIFRLKSYKLLGKEYFCHIQGH